MESCILLQCFCKPKETINVLNSLLKCIGINNYNLILYVDISNDLRFKSSNKELINKLNLFKQNNISKFKNIEIVKNNENKGPYKTCYEGIEYAFIKNNFVIFSEDDSIFTKDSIIYYNYYRDNYHKFNDDKCLGITADSINFYSENNNIYNNFEKMIIEYGIHNNKKDITEICLNKYCKDNIISIPSNDVIRAKMFGDPKPGTIKSIFINGEEYKHDEEINYNIYIPLKKNIYNNKKIEIKKQLNNIYLNYIQKINWAPNKQFGIFKEKWDKIKFFRNNNNNYIISKYNIHAPDTATGFYVKDFNYYFIYSYIPRCNDIGLFNILGCTQLYNNKKNNILSSTIKYLTTDDFIYTDLILDFKFYSGEQYLL